MCIGNIRVNIIFEIEDSSLATGFQIVNMYKAQPTLSFFSSHILSVSLQHKALLLRYFSRQFASSDKQKHEKENSINFKTFLCENASKSGLCFSIIIN